MEANEPTHAPASHGVRVDVAGSGRVNVAAGIPVLDHLLQLLAERARFDVTLEVAPGSADAEVAAAGRAIGDALYGALRAPGARSHGEGLAPADDALASVALEVAERPLLVSNVDLSRERIGGLEGDVVSRFLGELAAGACLTLHVRLLEGHDRQHVLDAIFKALGSALGEASRPVT
jgi:imidazoleglycerol-phosphate dehydratase